jgi:PhoH-like ATPase
LSIFNNINNRARKEGHAYLVPITSGVADVYKVAPKSKEQKLALHLLTHPDVSLVTLTGIAGSGKTYLSLAAGLSGLYSGQYERIVVTRSIEPVGRDIGFLPGDIKEKMAPWMNPFIDNFRQLLRDTTMFDMMLQKGQIEISPVTFIRGRSISNSFLIVDEAQNLTVHELKTIITRVGKGSKVVLMGDVDQIDTPYIDTLSNGLTVTIERFKGSPIFGHTTLRSGERSELATLAARLL